MRKEKINKSPCLQLIITWYMLMPDPLKFAFKELFTIWKGMVDEYSIMLCPPCSYVHSPLMAIIEPIWKETVKLPE
jgi:hypothetical protein